MADISKGVRAFALGTGISRVLGVVRELVFAYFFGAKMAADAYNAALRIPSLLRDLFAENILSNAFVPVLTVTRGEGKEAENRFASNILNTLLLVVGVVTFAGIFLSPLLSKLIAPGFGDIPGKAALTAKLTSILFPFLLFVALAAWAMSYLNTENEFFIPALAPAFFNVFSIAIPVALYRYLEGRGIDPILGMAIGFTTGGFIQFVIQIPRLRARGFVYRPFLNFRDPAFRRSMALFLPVAVGLSGSRIILFVNTVLISLLPQGSLSWMMYAYRIFFLPLGMFGVAVGQVALPAFSRYVNERRVDDLRRMLADSLRMVLFLTVPTAALIAALAGPIVGVLYERGRFTAADTQATAAILVLFMIGVPFISALRNIASVYYAYHDARRPMMSSFASVGVNIAVSLSLMGMIGFRAFPLAATVGAIVNIGILLTGLPGKIGAFPLRALFKYFGRLVLASLPGAAAAWGVNHVIVRWLGTSLVIKIGSIAAGGLFGLGIFYLFCLLLKVGEARDFVRRFLKI